MLRFFNKKHRLTLINQNWEIVVPNILMKNIPRYGEFIYLKDKNVYYKVENVIYTVDKKRDIFIVVKIFQQKNLVK